MKDFDIFEVKKKLDEEKAERMKDRKVTTGEKVVRLLVSAVALFMVYSVTDSITDNQNVVTTVAVILLILMTLRTYMIFKKR